MEPTGGYILLYRKIHDSFGRREKYCSKMAWIDLLLLANWKDNYFYVRDVKVEIKRGQVGWSEVQLANRWMWSRGRVRRFLMELQTEQRIVQHKSNVTSIIEIVNYNQYQQAVQQDEQQTVQQAVQQAVQQTVHGLKNIKKVIKKGINKPSCVDPEFEKFWAAYPARNGSKGDKPGAQKKWAGFSDEEKKLIFERLEQYRECDQWVKDGGRYIPMASSWLNQHQWESVPKPAKGPFLRADLVDWGKQSTEEET